MHKTVKDKVENAICKSNFTLFNNQWNFHVIVLSKIYGIATMNTVFFLNAIRTYVTHLTSKVFQACQNAKISYSRVRPHLSLKH
jgi:hypothetical protein